MVGIVLPVMVLVWWELDIGDSRGAGDNIQEVAACVQRGIVFYKKIGSYPLLKARLTRYPLSMMSCGSAAIGPR